MHSQEAEWYTHIVPEQSPRLEGVVWSMQPRRNYPDAATGRILDLVLKIITLALFRVIFDRYTVLLPPPSCLRAGASDNLIDAQGLWAPIERNDVTLQTNHAARSLFTPFVLTGGEISTIVSSVTSLA